MKDGSIDARIKIQRMKTLIDKNLSMDEDVMDKKTSRWIMIDKSNINRWMQRVVD